MIRKESHFNSGIRTVKIAAYGGCIVTFPAKSQFREYF